MRQLVENILKSVWSL